MLRPVALLAVVFVCATTAAVSQVHTPRPVKVVNHPLVQPVTGEELRASQELLSLLLVRMTGALPKGYATLETEECQVVGLTDFHRTSSADIGQSGCTFEAYTRLCSLAAIKHRLTCEETCSQFYVQGAHRVCRGKDRPVIEPFSPSRHCAVGPERVPWMSCTVTGWCNCDP